MVYVPLPKLKILYKHVGLSQCLIVASTGVVGYEAIKKKVYYQIYIIFKLLVSKSSVKIEYLIGLDALLQESKHEEILPFFKPSAFVSTNINLFQETREKKKKSLSFFVPLISHIASYLDQRASLYTSSDVGQDNGICCVSDFILQVMKDNI